MKIRNEKTKLSFKRKLIKNYKILKNLYIYIYIYIYIYAPLYHFKMQTFLPFSLPHFEPTPMIYNFFPNNEIS